MNACAYAHCTPMVHAHPPHLSYPARLPRRFRMGKDGTDTGSKKSKKGKGKRKRAKEAKKKAAVLASTQDSVGPAARSVSPTPLLLTPPFSRKKAKQPARMVDTVELISDSDLEQDFAIFGNILPSVDDVLGRMSPEPVAAMELSLVCTVLLSTSPCLPVV